MNRAILLLVVFIEGFASLGIEIIALRRLVPYVGSSITVTAPTIGLFLAALAAGYWTGGQVKSGFENRVLRNFLVAALIAGIGLSSFAVQRIFGAAYDARVAYLVFMAFVVCPPAWLLAQTVPLLANVIARERNMGRVGAASGAALTASTAGSVLGASVLALVVMQQLGVSAAVLLCSASLALAAPIASGGARRLGYAGLSALLLVPIAAINLVPRLNAQETAYADYRIVEQTRLSIETGGQAKSRVFIVNNQSASRLDPGDPPKRAPYVERMHQILLDEFQFQGKQVLVLGAGGFTLSGRDTTNSYTYVDVDSNIRDLAEQHFLHAPINGSFVAGDARRFVATTERRFDAIVVDVYTSHAAVPAHLVTLEFWNSLRQPLAPGGMVLINLILDSALRSPFARNLLATIERSLGRCGTEVLNRSQPASNVVVICRPAVDPAEQPQIYTDELNRVDLDRGIRGF